MCFLLFVRTNKPVRDIRVFIERGFTVLHMLPSVVNAAWIHTQLLCCFRSSECYRWTRRTQAQARNSCCCIVLGRLAVSCLHSENKVMMIVDLLIYKLVSAAFFKVVLTIYELFLTTSEMESPGTSYSNPHVRPNCRKYRVWLGWTYKTLVVTSDVRTPLVEPTFVFLSEEEKRGLCMIRLKPLKSPKPELLDWSILFSLVKLVLPVRASVTEPPLPLYRFY